MSKSIKNASHKTAVTQADVSRIQSTVAKQYEGKIPKGSYVGRMQSALAKQQKSGK